MCFTAAHTTLTELLVFELCLHSRLSFVYLSAISLIKKNQNLFLLLLGQVPFELPPCSPFAPCWIKSGG